MGASRHVPVMEREVLNGLMVEAGGCYLDCTLGGGGHTRALLSADPRATVVAVDRDGEAVARAQHELSAFGTRIELRKLRFSELAAALPAGNFDGMLADLGVSSDQLADRRGFSFNDDTPLDMRMDPHSGKTAYDIVNATSERELFTILKRGGVGKEAHGILRGILRARPIERTSRLAEVIRAAQAPGRGKSVDPATVAFQAIRIAVNDELEEIDALLEAAPVLLKRPGRFGAITFHSLEDKAVTSQMRAWSGADDEPALWPGVQGRRRLGMLHTKKPICPDPQEIAENPRARSARLRIFEFV